MCDGSLPTLQISNHVYIKLHCNPLLLFAALFKNRDSKQRLFLICEVLKYGLVLSRRLHRFKDANSLWIGLYPDQRARIQRLSQNRGKSWFHHLLQKNCRFQIFTSIRQTVEIQTTPLLEIQIYLTNQ